MLAVSLEKIKESAKEIQKTQGISYNQALHKASSIYGFSSYQALHAHIMDNDVSSDNMIEIFESTILKNRLFIKSLLKKLKKLSDKYQEARYNDDIESMEEYIELGDKLSSIIAGKIVGKIWHKPVDNQSSSLEGSAFAIYTSSDYITFHNDIDAHQADYILQINLAIFSFDLGYREFVVHKDEDYNFKEWGEWYERHILL